MVGSAGIRSCSREAHELEKFRMGHGMRRAERSQVLAWPVMGACFTVERTWRPGHSIPRLAFVLSFFWTGHFEELTCAVKMRKSELLQVLDRRLPSAEGK